LLVSLFLMSNAINIIIWWRRRRRRRRRKTIDWNVTIHK